MNKWWLTSEGVWQYGGWHNVMNGVAGLVNIFCMTAWWNVYPSKDKKDMIWADMTWVYIVIYDIWNFAYTYNCLPTHSWYCGVALLLAPTVAALLWNRGGWIQNRANTLAIWCMFAQVFPLFQETFMNGKQWFSWATLPVLYPNGAETVAQLYSTAGITAGTVTPEIVGTTVDPSVVAANPTMMIVISALALVTNCVALGYIVAQSKKRHINPYKEDVFVNQKYYKDAMARAVVE